MVYLLDLVYRCQIAVIIVAGSGWGSGELAGWGKKADEPYSSNSHSNYFISGYSAKMMDNKKVEGKLKRLRKYKKHNFFSSWLS